LRDLPLEFSLDRPVAGDQHENVRHALAETQRRANEVVQPHAPRQAANSEHYGSVLRPSQFGATLRARFPDREARHVHTAWYHVDLVGRHTESAFENLAERPREDDECARAAIDGPLDSGLHPNGESRLALVPPLQSPWPP